MSVETSDEDYLIYIVNTVAKFIFPSIGFLVLSTFNFLLNEHVWEKMRLPERETSKIKRL